MADRILIAADNAMKERERDARDQDIERLKGTSTMPCFCGDPRLRRVSGRA